MLLSKAFFSSSACLPLFRTSRICRLGESRYAHRDPGRAAEGTRSPEPRKSPNSEHNADKYRTQLKWDRLNVEKWAR